MICRWQAIVLCIALPLCGLAQEVPKFEWRAPAVGAGVFTDALGLHDREREEYANSLAAEASNGVAVAAGSAESLENARRLVALALHLSPRNRKALVLSFQLSRGVLPEVVDGSYRSEVLAGLLFTRSQALRRQGGPENELAARVFTELAAEFDPRNDDAVFANELLKLDFGPVDWLVFTESKESAPAESAP